MSSGGNDGTSPWHQRPTTRHPRSERRATAGARHLGSTRAAKSGTTGAPASLPGVVAVSRGRHRA
eukprot:5459072-Pyramimonas_sp.AAC.1